jgi:hypothetical protein
MFAITRGRLAAAAFGLSAAVATAQAPIQYGPVAGCPLGNCAAANHGTYGPALFAVNPPQNRLNRLAGPDEPGCVGRSSYPLTDWHYIRQFCGPTLHPGTCHGYYATKWRKWDDSCATPGGCNTAAVAHDLTPPAPLMIAPPATPVAPMQPSEKLPLPKEDKPKTELPKTDVPKVDPVTPPKVPLIPKDGSAGPAPLPVIPALPVPAPMPMPSEPGKINTTESLMPMPMPAVVVPVPEPRVVVPATPR